MLLVDYRAGSVDLIKPLQALGLPAEEADLEFGDLAFTGRGDRGAPVEVGIEFKKLSELIGSLRTERLQGHQLPGMMGQGGAYDIGYLLIEGDWTFNTAGLLTQPPNKWKKHAPLKVMPGAMNVSEYLKRLHGLHLRGGLTPFHTNTRPQTLQWIASCYRTWTDKDFNDHDSHLGMYLAPTMVPISDERQVLCRLPGVGAAVSKAAIAKFKTVKRAMNANVQEWADLQTLDKSGKSRKFGVSKAQKVVDFLEGR